jgi:hypothetical protein
MHSVIEQIKAISTTRGRAVLASIAELMSIEEKEEGMRHDAEVSRRCWDILRADQLERIGAIIFRSLNAP